MIYDSSTHIRHSENSGLIPVVALDNGGNVYGGVSPFSPFMTDTGHLKVVSSTEQYSISGYPFGTDTDNWLNTADSIGHTISHLADSRGMRVAINGTNTSKVKRQSARVFTYAAGNDHDVTFATKYELQNGARAQIGYFDNDNGLFFRIDKALGEYTISTVRRSKASGTLEEEVIPQSNWNIDKLDGTGVSGKTLNKVSIQMMFISFTWYGGGSAILGFKIDRELIPVHIFTSANRLSHTLIGEPNQPFRIEVTNQGVSTAGTSNIDIWGLHLAINGSDPAQRIGNPFSIRTLNRSVSAGNSYHILSIKPEILFKGINNRAWIKIRDFAIWGDTGGSFRVIYNANFIDPTYASSWLSVDSTNSFTSYNTFNSAFTGGRLFQSGGFTANKGGDSIVLPEFREPITPLSDFSNTNKVSLIFDCTTNGTINAAFNWAEI